MNDKQVVINVAKGIEQSTLMRLSEVAKEINPNVKYAVCQAQKSRRRSRLETSNNSSHRFGR